MAQSSLLEMKINNEPKEFAEYMKKNGDIFWWEQGNFWVITSHAYAKGILTSSDYTCDRSPFFISRMPNLDLQLITDFFHVINKMMVMSDAPAHTSRRRICYDGFSNQTLQILQPLIYQTVMTRLQQCKRKGFIEIVSDLAQVLPSTILADFFHIPESEREDFYNWSNNMTQFFGGSSQYRNEDGKAVNHSAKCLYDYFAQLIALRRKNPKQDFLSILLKNQHAFELSDDEIISQAIMMLVAGQVTTTDQMCNNIYTLMTTPGALTSLKNNLSSIDNAIAELNRLDPAVTFIFRVTNKDTMIGEQAIKKGDVIFIATHAVNRDPNVFVNPHACDFNRNANKHLSYGFGSHYCLGAKLAQMEMEYCLQQLLVQFPDLKIADEVAPKRKHHSLAFSGFERLTLSFN